jgi:hypothetical protein
MPGFNIEGAWAEGPNSMTELRRKHRWLFTIPSALVRATLYLQKAQRPQVKFGEAIMHHDQEQAYFAGKSEWSPISLEFYDAEQSPDVSKFIWDWVNRVCQIPAVTVDPPGRYKKKAQLEMRDGKGKATETWSLWNCWPVDTNWNELDYSSSDIALITVSMRFDRAVRG